MCVLAKCWLAFCILLSVCVSCGFCHHCNMEQLRLPLFLIVFCERLHSLLILVMRILSVVTVINLDPCLKLCLHGNYDWKVLEFVV